MTAFFTLFAITYLLVLVILANMLDRHPVPANTTPPLTYPFEADRQPVAPPASVASSQPHLKSVYQFLVAGLLGTVALNGMGFLFGAIVPGAFPDAPPTPLSRAALIAGLTVLAVGACGLVLFSESVRVRMAALWDDAFRASSYVHQTAFVLSLLLLLVTLTNVLQAGGVEGLAEQYEQQPISQWDSILTLFALIVVAFLGVGLRIRRSWSEALQRLDLRLPTAADFLWGVLTALGCVMLVFVFTSILSVLLPSDVLEAQGAASNQIAQVLAQSLWIAFLAAVSAAIGEEILFRGALQPIFGIIPTTLLFALLHSQYAFTPGSVAILVVGGAFAYLKQWQSTTAAIIAHFAYNFILLSLAYLVLRLEEMGITPETFEGMLYLFRGLGLL
jgi:uncharacterized protein